MKNYNWEYFKSQINKSFQNQKQKYIYSQRKIDVEPVFGFMKAILGFTRMSVRGLNKVKRELGFVLMALNIRKVVAQRAENNQKFIKRQFLYYFNRNCLFHLSKNFMSRTLFICHANYIGKRQDLTSDQICSQHFEWYLHV